MKRNLIPSVKRNEEIGQIFALDQMDDEFERVLKEWQDDDDKDIIVQYMMDVASD